jgi:hypothetical protein
MSEIDREEWLQLFVNVTVDVKSLDEIGWVQWLGIQKGAHLAFYVDGIHYDFSVIECKERIRPGASGSAVFLTLSDALLQTGVQPGSLVELRRGSVVLGHAHIDGIARVWVVRDRTAEKGYRFSRGPVPI